MPSHPPTLPCALAIGGLDPGGGAGIAADLRAMAAAGAFGCAAVAAITVQSTAGLRRVREVPARELISQVDEVMRHQRVLSVKVGALGGSANVRAIAKLLGQHPAIPVVVDTPMAPTRGRARLLDSGGIEALKDILLPRATLVTVNIDEAQSLLGRRVRSVHEAREAARAIAALGPRAALVKGGHLTGDSAVDVLAVQGEVIELRARRLAIPGTHGSGCTFASLIAGRLAARGRSRSRGAGAPLELSRSRSRGAGAPLEPPVDRDTLVAAVRWAKRAHHAALRHTVDVGRGLRVIVF